jgi:hypothetical protein
MVTCSLVSGNGYHITRCNYSEDPSLNYSLCLLVSGLEEWMRALKDIKLAQKFLEISTFRMFSGSSLHMYGQI